MTSKQIDNLWKEWSNSESTPNASPSSSSQSAQSLFQSQESTSPNGDGQFDYLFNGSGDSDMHSAAARGDRRDDLRTMMMELERFGTEGGIATNVNMGGSTGTSPESSAVASTSHSTISPQNEGEGGERTREGENGNGTSFNSSFELFPASNLQNTRMDDNIDIADLFASTIPDPPGSSSSIVPPDLSTTISQLLSSAPTTIPSATVSNPLPSSSSPLSLPTSSDSLAGILPQNQLDFIFNTSSPMSMNLPGQVDFDWDTLSKSFGFQANKEVPTTIPPNPNSLSHFLPSPPSNQSNKPELTPVATENSLPRPRSPSRSNSKHRKHSSNSTIHAARSHTPPSPVSPSSLSFAFGSDGESDDEGRNRKQNSDRTTCRLHVSRFARPLPEFVHPRCHDPNAVAPFWDQWSNHPTGLAHTLFTLPNGPPGSWTRTKRAIQQPQNTEPPASPTRALDFPLDPALFSASNLTPDGNPSPSNRADHNSDRINNDIPCAGQPFVKLEGIVRAAIFTEVSMKVRDRLAGMRGRDDGETESVEMKSPLWVIIKMIEQRYPYYWKKSQEYKVKSKEKERNKRQEWSEEGERGKESERKWKKAARENYPIIRTIREHPDKFILHEDQLPSQNLTQDVSSSTATPSPNRPRSKNRSKARPDLSYSERTSIILRVEAPCVGPPREIPPPKNGRLTSNRSNPTENRRSFPSEGIKGADQPWNHKRKSSVSSINMARTQRGDTLHDGALLSPLGLDIKTSFSALQDEEDFRFSRADVNMDSINETRSGVSGLGFGSLELRSGVSNSTMFDPGPRQRRSLPSAEDVDGRSPKRRKGASEDANRSTMSLVSDVMGRKRKRQSCVLVGSTSPESKIHSSNGRQSSRSRNDRIDPQHEFSFSTGSTTSAVTVTGSPTVEGHSIKRKTSDREELGWGLPEPRSNTTPTSNSSRVPRRRPVPKSEKIRGSGLTLVEAGAAFGPGYPDTPISPSPDLRRSSWSSSPLCSPSHPTPSAPSMPSPHDSPFSEPISGSSPVGPPRHTAGRSPSRNERISRNAPLPPLPPLPRYPLQLPLADEKSQAFMRSPEIPTPTSGPSRKIVRAQSDVGPSVSSSLDYQNTFPSQSHHQNPSQSAHTTPNKRRRVSSRPEFEDHRRVHSKGHPAWTTANSQGISTDTRRFDRNLPVDFHPHSPLRDPTMGRYLNSARNSPPQNISREVIDLDPSSDEDEQNGGDDKNKIKRRNPAPLPPLELPRFPSLPFKPTPG